MMICNNASEKKKKKTVFLPWNLYGVKDEVKPLRRRQKKKF
jgi:hypothetical protein